MVVLAAYCLIVGHPGPALYHQNKNKKSVQDEEKVSHFDRNELSPASSDHDRGQ
jgi:hypothetical protein